MGCQCSESAHTHTHTHEGALASARGASACLAGGGGGGYASAFNAVQFCRERAHHTVEDFALSYLPLHGLDTKWFLANWPLLVFVEGTM